MQVIYWGKVHFEGMGTPLDIVALTTALRLVALSMQDSIYSAHNPKSYSD